MHICLIKDGDREKENEENEKRREKNNKN